MIYYKVIEESGNGEYLDNNGNICNLYLANEVINGIEEHIFYNDNLEQAIIHFNLKINETI